MGQGRVRFESRLALFRAAKFGLHSKTSTDTIFDQFHSAFCFCLSLLILFAFQKLLIVIHRLRHDYVCRVGSAQTAVL